MSDDDVVMTFDKPHFVVRLYPSVLKVDLKDGARSELEKIVEANPVLRDTLGLLFQSVIPLDVKLKDIRSVGLDKKGNVKVDIPLRKDLIIPLNGSDAESLIDKLNELISAEKERETRDLEAERRAEQDRVSDEGYPKWQSRQA